MFNNKHEHKIKIHTVDEKNERKQKRKKKMKEKREIKKVSKKPSPFGDTKPVKSSKYGTGPSLWFSRLLQTEIFNNDSETYKKSDKEKQYELLLILKDVYLPSYDNLDYHLKKCSNEEQMRDVYLKHVTHSTYCKCSNLDMNICYYCFTLLTDQTFVSSRNNKYEHNYEEDFELIAKCLECNEKMSFYFENKRNYHNDEYIELIFKFNINLCYHCFENNYNDPSHYCYYYL